MLDVKIVLDAVPDYLFKACGAETQDERDTVAACVRTYTRDCITATLLTIEDGPIFKDAWRYRVMVENGAVPTQWHEIISEQREGFRARADAAFDDFVSEELSDYEYGEHALYRRGKRPSQRSWRRSRLTAGLAGREDDDGTGRTGCD